MSEPTINMDILFGHVELMDAPPRIEGDRLITRGRSITYDRHGNVTKDETYDLAAILGWEDSAHLWGVAAPRRAWWQRLKGWL